MGVTNFPNGISTGGVTLAPSATIAGTVISGAGTVATGLTTCTGAVATLSGTLLGTAVAGSPFGVTATASGASVIIRVHDIAGAAATGSGTVNVVSFGT